MMERFSVYPVLLRPGMINYDYFLHRFKIGGGGSFFGGNFNVIKELITHAFGKIYFDFLNYGSG